MDKFIYLFSTTTACRTLKCQWVGVPWRYKERKTKMGFMKVITPDGVVDIEDMTAEELLGLQVALMSD